MAERQKVFCEYDDVGRDEPIGGALRLQAQKVPRELFGLFGLVNGGDPKDVERLREEVRGKEVVIEIGPGKGAFLCAMAALWPQRLCVGFEVRLGFCSRTLRKAKKAGLENVRVVWGDARLTIPLVLEPEQVCEAYILFPDPWWKRSHAGRRHGPMLVEALARVLRASGLVVIKSDVEGYLQDLQKHFLQSGLFEETSVPRDLPLSNRERKLLGTGTKVFALALIKR